MGSTPLIIYVGLISIIQFTLKFLALIVPALLAVAFITLLERKILGLIGIRLGPNKTSIMGVLQPISDALKLSNKQVNFLSNRSYLFYYFRAGFILFRSLLVWSCIFIQPALISWKAPLVVILLALAFNSFNSILAG